MLSSSRCPLHILFCMVYIARAACLACKPCTPSMTCGGCPKLQPGRASVGQNRRALQKYTSRCMSWTSAACCWPACMRRAQVP